MTSLLILTALVCLLVDHSLAVVELTDATFYDYAKDKEVLLVDFFAPWCSDCKALEPDFESAAASLGTRSLDLAKVDCFGAGKGLCATYGVRRWPTLKNFNRGSYTGDYNGGLTASEIAGYITTVENSVVPASNPYAMVVPQPIQQACISRCKINKIPDRGNCFQTCKGKSFSTHNGPKRLMNMKMVAQKPVINEKSCAKCRIPQPTGRKRCTIVVEKQCDEMQKLWNEAKQSKAGPSIAPDLFKEHVVPLPKKATKPVTGAANGYNVGGQSNNALQAPPRQANMFENLSFQVQPQAKAYEVPSGRVQSQAKGYEVPSRQVQPQAKVFENPSLTAQPQGNVFENPSVPVQPQANVFETPSVPEQPIAKVFENPRVPEQQQAKVFENPSVPVQQQAKVFENPSEPEQQQAKVFENPSVPFESQAKAFENQNLQVQPQEQTNKPALNSTTLIKEMDPAAAAAVAIEETKTPVYQEFNPPNMVSYASTKQASSRDDALNEMHSNEKSGMDSGSQENTNLNPIANEQVNSPYDTSSITNNTQTNSVDTSQGSNEEISQFQMPYNNTATQSMNVVESFHIDTNSNAETGSKGAANTALIEQKQPDSQIEKVSENTANNLETKPVETPIVSENTPIKSDVDEKAPVNELVKPLNEQSKTVAPETQQVTTTSSAETDLRKTTEVVSNKEAKPNITIYPGIQGKIKPVDNLPHDVALKLPYDIDDKKTVVPKAKDLTDELPLNIQMTLPYDKAAKKALIPGAKKLTSTATAKHKDRR